MTDLDVYLFATFCMFGLTLAIPWCHGLWCVLKGFEGLSSSPCYPVTLCAGQIICMILFNFHGDTLKYKLLLSQRKVSLMWVKLFMQITQCET